LDICNPRVCQKLVTRVTQVLLQYFFGGVAQYNCSSIPATAISEGKSH
jgi:hypothetical protein